MKVIAKTIVKEETLCIFKFYLSAILTKSFFLDSIFNYFLVEKIQIPLIHF